MKKEISDHLARVFFESVPARGRKRERSFLYYVVLSVGIAAAFVLSAMLISKTRGKDVSASGEVLRFQRNDGPHKLSFDFSRDKANVATFSAELPFVDLSGFKKMGFSVKLHEAQARKTATLKVSIVNKRREVSSLYIRQIDHLWKQVVVPFSSFTDIRDWSQITGISFSLEPWNSNAEKGKLLIDDIQFFKN